MQADWIVQEVGQNNKQRNENMHAGKRVEDAIVP